MPGTVRTRRRPSSEKKSRQALKLERRERAEQAGYDVGYAKPPEANRFKKGQSGNPKGRPRGSKNFLTTLKEALDTKVVVRENGWDRQISKLEAIVTQTVNGAAAGRIAFIKLAVALIERVDTAGAEDHRDTLSPEDIALLERLLKP